MKEYRLLVPVGAVLPKAGKLIKVEDDGNHTMVMVSSIRSMTWGTSKRKTPPHDDVVAGVFVDFWGAPWPPILVPGGILKKSRKHVVAYDKITGLRVACFGSDDVMEEVPEDSCPHCAEKEQALADDVRQTADSASMAALMVLTKRYGDDGLDDAIPDICRAIYGQVKANKELDKLGNGLELSRG